MIIAVSGSVGCGKTSFASAFAKKISSEIIHLNEFSKKYYIDYNKETDSYEVDIDMLFKRVIKEIDECSNKGEDLVIEGHFAHLLYPKKVDILIILNRPLEELKTVYGIRRYSEKKSSDNLEVEAFDTCYNEALEEGYAEKQIVRVENGKGKTMHKVVSEFLDYYENY